MTLRSAADPMAQQGHLVGTGLDPVGRPPATGALPARNSMPWPASWRTSPDSSNSGRCCERILRHAVGLLGCHSGSICTVDERAGPTARRSTSAWRAAPAMSSR